MHLIDVNNPRNQHYVSQEVIESMQRIPPIDPESLRPQGEWIVTKEYNDIIDMDIVKYTCSA